MVVMMISTSIARILNLETGEGGGGWEITSTAPLLDSYPRKESESKLQNKKCYS